MDDKKRRSPTQQLIAEAEALRSGDASNDKRPGTRTLVRESEELIGRRPRPVLPAGVKTLLGAALASAAFALALALVFLLWA